METGQKWPLLKQSGFGGQAGTKTAGAEEATPGAVALWVHPHLAVPPEQEQRV